MWKYFKRKRAEKELAEKRKAAEELIVQDGIKVVEQKAWEIAQKRNEFWRKSEEKSDRTCPVCGGAATDRIKRQQGSVNGSVSGSSWNALTFGSGYLSGKISGSFDTIAVNKCGSCKHEWNKSAPFRQWGSTVIKSEVSSVKEFLRLRYISEKTRPFTEENISEFWGGIDVRVLVKIVNESCFTQKEQDDFKKSYNESLLLELGFIKTEITL